MPRIEIQDYFGSFYRVDSSDPDVIKNWLIEQARNLVSTNSALGYIRMNVWPIFGPMHHDGKADQDWPPGDFRDLRITAEAMHELADWLQAHKVS